MSTVTILFNTTEGPLVFTDVTSYKYDPSNGNISIVHGSGDFNGALENVQSIDIN